MQLRDGHPVLRPKRPADAEAITGELVAAPRSDTDEPVNAFYTWTAS